MELGSVSTQALVCFHATPPSGGNLRLTLRYSTGKRDASQNLAMYTQPSCSDLGVQRQEPANREIEA